MRMTRANRFAELQEKEIQSRIHKKEMEILEIKKKVAMYELTESQEKYL